MPRNPYFKDYSGEQTVTEDITIETIQTLGRDMVYIPRNRVSKDDLFGEDSNPKFDDVWRVLKLLLRVKPARF